MSKSQKGMKRSKKTKLKMSKAKIDKIPNSATLNKYQIRIIRRLCKNSNMAQREIATVFNLGQQQIIE